MLVMLLKTFSEVFLNYFLLAGSNLTLLTQHCTSVSQFLGGTLVLTNHNIAIWEFQPLCQGYSAKLHRGTQLRQY